MIRKKPGKILDDKWPELFEQVKNISENIHNNYSRKNEFIKMKYIPYCHLIRNFGNYHLMIIYCNNCRLFLKEPFLFLESDSKEFFNEVKKTLILYFPEIKKNGT